MRVFGECDSDGCRVRLFEIDDLKTYRKLLAALRKRGYTVTYYDDYKMLDYNATHKYIDGVVVKVKFVENEV